MPPICLTIAGSDSGGGAGIQADLKTFAALGAYGASAITALTAQNTRGVRAVHCPDPSFVAAQIDAVFEDLPVAAVKIGMLAHAGIVEVVADRLLAHRPPYVVLDPVMVAASGDRLLAADAVRSLVDRLFPLATLVTPNLPEAEVLAGGALPADPEVAARRLLDLGAPAVLLKGGHRESPEVVDALATGTGLVRRWSHPRLLPATFHGTGCTLAAAIAARLAQGRDLPDAVGDGILYVAEGLAHAFPVGEGARPVHHQWRWWTS